MSFFSTQKLIPTLTAILDNRNGYGGLRWTTVPLKPIDSKSSWARYALADSKASSRGAVLVADPITWLPQLSASSREDSPK